MWQRGSVAPDTVRRARAWGEQRRALGNSKQKAAELGITVHALRRIVQGRNYRWVP